MSIHFVDREKELEFLSRQFDEYNPFFVVIYGKRRVGKSELIKKFLAGRKSIYLLATTEVEKEIIANFSRGTAEFFNDAALAVNPLTSFRQFLEYLKKKDIKERIIVAIDEFPYLVDANKAVPSILQSFWDEYFRNSRVSFVLSGSSISAMENGVLARKSPLYGRRTGQWKMAPFNFRNFSLLFPKLSLEKRIEFFAVTGGTPYYANEFRESFTLYANVVEKIASKGAVLHDEVMFLLREELREPKTYYSILKEISAGKTKVTEIGNAVGIERTSLFKYLNTLTFLDLIKVEYPVTSKERSKNSIYLIKDNYFGFWFKMIAPLEKEIELGNENLFRQYFEQNIESFIGRRFEAVCEEAFRVLMEQGKLPPGVVGRWWGNYLDENGEKKTAEIDLVSVNKITKSIVFAECKWSNKRAGIGDLMEHKMKAALVEWNKDKRTEKFLFFSKSGFDQKALDFASENNWMLVDLKELGRIFSA